MERRSSGETGALPWTRRSLWYWLPALVYAAGIFYASSLPQPEELMPSLLEAVGDKVLHGVEYGLLGILWYRALRHAAGEWAARHALGLAVAVAIGYGATDELHQAFVPQREADVADLAADAVGAIVATWIWHRLASKGQGAGGERRAAKG